MTTERSCDGYDHDGSRCERAATRYVQITDETSGTDGEYCNRHAATVIGAALTDRPAFTVRVEPIAGERA